MKTISMDFDLYENERLERARMFKEIGFDNCIELIKKLLQRQVYSNGQDIDKDINKIYKGAEIVKLINDLQFPVHIGESCSE